VSEIVFDKVSAGYDRKIVFENLSFTLEKHDFMVIFGPNGVGKTTLAKTILGIISPISGSTYVLGCTLHGVCPHKKMIGYVPQVYNLDPDFPATLFDIVLTGCYPLLKPTEKVHQIYIEQAYRNLKTVGLIEFKDVPFSKLSSGQQKRGLLARALMGPPKILLLDEPTAGVDLVSEVQVNLAIETAFRDFNIPVIAITHDINPYLSIATKVIIMGYGKHYAGRIDEILREEILSEIYRTKVDVLEKEGKRYINIRDAHYG